MDEKKRRNTGMSTIMHYIQRATSVSTDEAVNLPDSFLAAIIEKELKLAYERGYRAGVRTEMASPYLRCGGPLQGWT